jgi:predicted permease
MNSGNFGLSLTSFALGEVGLAWATIYFVTSSMMTNSLGVYVTSVGKRTPQQALLGLLRVPAVYAIPVALLVRISDITLPLPITRPIELLGRATVPSMLILLGMQISRSGLPKHPKLLLGSSALRLVISPLIAWLIAPLFNLTGMAFQAGIIETATPTAVLTMVIATEFDVEPEFVTSAVMITTILSPLTLTPLLAILGI